MAHRLLHLGRKFAERLAEFRDQEEGIVAEASRAASIGHDDAMTAPLGRCHHRPLRVTEDGGADVVRGPRIAVRRGHFAEQPGVVGGIVALLAGVASRVDPRRAAERRDHQSAILADRPFVEGQSDLRGLERCVADEAVGGFLDFGRVRVGCQIGQIEAQVAEQLDHLLQLLLVAAGEHESRQDYSSLIEPLSPFSGADSPHRFRIWSFWTAFAPDSMRMCVKLTQTRAIPTKMRLKLTAFDHFEPRFSRGICIFDPPLPPPLFNQMRLRPANPVVFAQAAWGQ